MLFIVRWLQELGWQRTPPLRMCSIGLQKTYDLVERALLWEALKRSGAPTKMHTNTRTFQKSGVLSTLLFNVFFAAALHVVHVCFSTDEAIV